MSEELPTHKQFESKVTSETFRRHKDKIDLMTGMVKVYIDGFNLINTFKYEEGKNDVTYAWIYLVMHSLHSMWCSLRLMLRGYYGQTMALLRMVTEDWFICEDCRTFPKTLDAILRGKYRIPSLKDKLTFRQMAIRINAKLIYEQDYAYASKFTHPSVLSMSILEDTEAKMMRIAPTYEDLLFLSCCEAWIRNALRMTAYIGNILSSLSDDKAKTWWDDAESRVKAASDWLKLIQEKHSHT